MVPENPSRVLVVEDSPTQALYISSLLAEAGFQVEAAANGREAMDLLRRRLPDVIVTDLEMPVMNGLELVEAVRREFPSVPVLLITAHGSEQIAAVALRKGAASYVPKSLLEQDLLPTLTNILSVTQADRHHQRALECLTRIDSIFVLENDVTLIPPLISHLDSLLARLKFGDPTGRMRVGVALHEALVNAIQHGNLEVSSDLRQQDENIYRDLVEQRRQQSPYRDRRVHFHVKVSPAEVVCAIRDEGPGFDPSRLPDPTDPANLERIGGRGLLLIRTFMDRVSYNDTGNEIIMSMQKPR
jgi:CheY-like chemotaxis protein